MTEDTDKSENWLKMSLYLWSVLTVLIVLALSWFLIKDRSKNNESEKIVSPTETSKQTVQWKSFEDLDNRWKVKYPSEWGDPYKRQQMVEFTTTNYNVIDVMFFEDNSKLIADYLVKYDKQSKTAWEGKPSLKVDSTKKTVINGLNCIQREEEVLAAGFTRTATYFKSQNKMVVIYLNPIGDNTSIDREIYDQMLKSFEFLK